MAMLPALTNGTHSFIFNDSYPKITDYTNGSLINNAYYDIANNILAFNIHDDDQINNLTNVSVSGLNNTEYYVFKGPAKILTFTPTLGSYTFVNLSQGQYKVTTNNKASIIQILMEWVNALLNFLLNGRLHLIGGVLCQT
jgi:hypothetical protein